MFKARSVLGEVWRYYWPFLRTYKFLVLFTFLAYGLGVFLATSYLSLVYKRIFDLMEGGNFGIELELWKNFGIIILITISYNLFYRLGDYLIVKTQIGFFIRKIYSKKFRSFNI